MTRSPRPWLNGKKYMRTFLKNSDYLKYLHISFPDLFHYSRECLSDGNRLKCLHVLFLLFSVQVCPKIVLEPWHLIQRHLDWPGWDNLGSNSPIEIDHITLHRRLPTPTLGRLALFSFSLSLSPFSSVSPLSFSECWCT